jgi:hypothetical protein
MEFREELRDFLLGKFPGAEIVDLDANPRSKRLGGVLAWPEFGPLTPLERQNKLWAALRTQFPADKLRQISMIITFTPEELQAVDEP